jgi:hypothetical protein
LCGECIFKLRLFAKPQTSNSTINPVTGEEEVHRATVVVKPEYQAQCEQAASSAGKITPSSPSPEGQSSSPTTTGSHLVTINDISDPALDVDFIAQCRSRDAVCLFCHVPITPLLLSKTPIKPATYQLLTLLHKMDSAPKGSNLYVQMRQEAYNLVNITHQQAALNKKTFSNFIETSFVYNANLDLYTLPQDGIEFAETIENTASINCKSCVANNDSQRHYTQSRTLTTTINDDFSVTYQTMPLIVHTRTKFHLMFQCQQYFHQLNQLQNPSLC